MKFHRSSNLNSESSRGALTRRTFAARLAALCSCLGVARFAGASSSSPGLPNVAAGDEISRSAESIHMEVTFNASPARVYELLTDPKQFSKVIALSAAMKSMAIPAKPAEISRDPGGAFSLFGGYVTGRHIELAPGQRLVQAWRPASWDAGVYSIVRFELSVQGSGTKISFDHTGFPKGDADHLLAGWNGNYWEPLAKVLAQPS